MQVVRIDLDDGVLLRLQRTPEELAGELRLVAGVVSQVKGAQKAGLNRSAFVEALGRFGVSTFRENADDILSAVRDA